MSGTFSSLSGALSALRYNRVAMDVASGNVANANTEGYTRRMAVAQAVGAPGVPALWSRWDSAVVGVEVGGIPRMTDQLLDSRSRAEHSSLSYLDAKAASLVRFETSLGEPGDGGIAAKLAAFKQGWHDVANNPGDVSARSVLLGKAEDLRLAIAAQDRSVRTEWSDQRAQLDTVAKEANQVASDLATLNKTLHTAYMTGTDANALLDQRDQVTMRLAQLTGGTVTPNEDTTVDVKIGGVPLVTGENASAIAVSGAKDLAGASGDPVTITVDGTAVPPDSMSRNGELGASYDLVHDDLHGYLGKLDAFVADLASQTNRLHRVGAGLDQVTGRAFFSGRTAADLAVAVTDPRQVAAATPGKGTLDASNADLIGTADLGASTYRSVVSGFGVTVASVQRTAENQAAVTSQVDASRESVSGVNVDEEMVNLLAAQRAYEGASRVITAIDSVLDTLINRTGLTR